jgi:hypothetical protein
MINKKNIYIFLQIKIIIIKIWNNYYKIWNNYYKNLE